MKGMSHSVTFFHKIQNFPLSTFPSQRGFYNFSHWFYDQKIIEKKKTPIQLPVINNMVSTLLRQKHKIDLNNKNTVVVGVQHMLETNLPVMDALINLGISPHNMYFSGKYYSSSLMVDNQLRERGIFLMSNGKPEGLGQYQEYAKNRMKQLWDILRKDIETKNKKIDRIIVLDEGGRCLENMPEFMRFKYAIAGIEQTRAGLYSELLHKLPFPLIDVSSCAAKKLLESVLIAETTLRKVKSIFEQLKLQRDTVCGVVGNGAIGHAIVSYLLSQGYPVLVYDSNPDTFKNIQSKEFCRFDSVSSVIANAQCIFGCTGLDITENIDVLALVKNDKIFMSCSSEDKEFLSLLKTIAARSIVTIDPLANITCLSNSKSKITIFRGGTPVTFDNSSVAVDANDIQLTRGLILGGCIQGMMMATKPSQDTNVINRPMRQSLDSHLQRFVVNCWKDYQPPNRYAPQLLKNFENTDWIKENSGGIYQENATLSKLFAGTEPLSQDNSEESSIAPLIRIQG